MTLPLIHDRLADAATMFVAVLALWALVLRLRSQPLDGNWMGAAVIAELLLIAQVVVGTILYAQGLGAALPRPFLHILYAIVAILTLPAAHAYFSALEHENVRTLAMAFACFFLWGILLRTSSVALYLLPA